MSIRPLDVGVPVDLIAMSPALLDGRDVTDGVGVLKGFRLGLKQLPGSSPYVIELLECSPFSCRGIS